MVPAGGPYYMISRNLGPELGGAVGILFYLGTTVAASMYITGTVGVLYLQYFSLLLLLLLTVYLANCDCLIGLILGAAEIFLLYLVPQAKMFDDLSNCYRIYGTCVLLFLGLIVIAGVRVVNKFALPTVIIVNLCIVLSFIGVFYNFYGSDRLQ